MKKKAYNIDHLTNEQKLRLKSSSNYAGLLGINGDPLIEAVPRMIKAKNERWIENNNGASICLGLDRPGSLGTGHNGETGTAQIDILAGPSSAKLPPRNKNGQTGSPTPVAVDPNLALDAARITISQMTDVDENHALAGGVLGSVKNKSAVLMKADSVRHIAREGFSVHTGVDKLNSAGAPIRSVPRIQFIAGNNDSGISPVAMADKTNDAIKMLLDEIQTLQSQLDAFIQHQVEFNFEIQSHEHLDPLLMLIGLIAGGNPFAINNGKVMQSPELLQSGIKNIPSEMLAKVDGIMQQVRLAFEKVNTTTPAGPANTASRSVYTT